MQSLSCSSRPLLSKTRFRSIAFGAALIVLLPTNLWAQDGQDLAAELEDRIVGLRLQGKYTEAAETARELLGVWEADPDAKSYQVRDAKRLVQTLEHVARMSTEAQQELALADSLYNLILDCYQEDRCGECVGAAIQQLEIRRRLLGDDHPEIGRTLHEIAKCLWSEGNYARAESLHHEALAIQRKLLGSKHPDVAEGLCSLGNCRYSTGNYAAAESLYRESLAMQRELMGDEVEAVGITLTNLSAICQLQADYVEAEASASEALTIWTKLLGEEHPNIGICLNNLACLQILQGKHESAAQLLRRALVMQRKLLGDEHPDIARSLTNLSHCLHVQGRCAEAEPIIREALAMWRRILGNEHPHVATCLNNLGQLLQTQGNYAGAAPLYDEALEMMKKFLGEEHPEIATVIGNLGQLCTAQGKFKDAEAYEREALAMRRKLLGNEHPDVAKSLNNLAHTLQSQGSYSLAESSNREALVILQRAHGNIHPDVATCLNNLGAVLFYQGNYAEAGSLYHEAFTMRRELLGNEHPDVSQSIQNLANLQWLEGNHVQAKSLLTEAARVHDAARLRIESGFKRSAFQASPYPDLAMMRLILGNTEGAWSAVEKSLARSLADLMISTQRRRLSPLEFAREDSLIEILANLERQLSTYVVAARSDTTEASSVKANETRNLLWATEAEWGVFQREISKKYPVTEGQIYQLERIQACLTRDTALVGWLLDNHGNQSDREGVDSVRSWCYIIRKTGPVHWVELGAFQRDPETQSGVDATKIHAFRQKLALAARFPVQVEELSGITKDSQVLWKEWFSPLIPHLDNTSKVIILPSNPMLGIPIEAFLDENGIYVGDRYAISYAPSATIYTWLREEGAARSAQPECKALLVGDPPFAAEHLVAMESEDIELQTQGIDQELEEHLLASNALRATDMGSILAGNDEALSRLPRLPWSRQEARQVAPLFREATLLLGPEASEQEIVRLAESRELLEYDTIHFATHALVHDEFPERSALVLSQVDLPNALEAAEAGTRIYDGLLSAKEILQEWDLDADLVTLSACQSGLGQETAGEGYIGLATAFLQAGARSLLVSLWHVDDRATSLFMKRFYENLTGAHKDDLDDGSRSPMSKAAALQEARRWLREYRDETGRQPYRHPAYWSAFILIGDS